MADRALSDLEEVEPRRDAGEGLPCRICGARTEWGHAMRCPECGGTFGHMVDLLEGHGMKPSRHVTPTKAHCAACGKKFAATRRDSRYCGAACRQRAYRARVGVVDIDRRIDEAKRLYWSLIREKVEGTGRGTSQVVTDEAQLVDEQGNVFIRGRLVGKRTPFREGWTAWGLETAGPPFSPPTEWVAKMVEVPA